MKKRAYNLMKLWCDTLLSHQIHTNTPYTNNAIVCPACHSLHGRIADLCFPLVILWERTGEERYLIEADNLIDWSEYNLKTHDGVWYNDAPSRWFGTSAFSAMSIAEAIMHFGDKLPQKYKDKWTAIFIRMADAIADFDKLVGFMPPTNYYCGFATALATAWKLTGNKAYYEKSKYWIELILPRFDDEGLLFGEGPTEPAADKSRAIDMGYNLEESIPLLVRYSAITGEHTERFKKAMLDHLEFLLPDGAIDNSFGTRHNKWTYWGSRTSDGLIEGLALLLDEPIFADACERVLSLYEKCTHDGLLAMPMAHEVGEPTCIHHTFTHARALASLVCSEGAQKPKRTILPSDKEYGIKKFQSGRLIIASKDGFRATVSAIQARYVGTHADTGGGSLNLLYHREYGVICAATMAQYIPDEPLNQQYLRNSPNPPPCMTAQLVINGNMCCHDTDVVLSSEGVGIIAASKDWQAKYSIENGKFQIDVSCEYGIYNLPIICSKKSKAELSEDKKVLIIDGKLSICSDTPLTVDCDKRVFNQVGGLLYLPIEIAVTKSANISIKYE